MLQRRSCPDESSRDSVTVLARDWLPISGGKGFGNKTVWPWSFSCSQVSSHLGLPFNWNFQVANLSKPCLNVIVLYKSSPSLLHIFYAQNTSKPEHPSKTAISAPAFGEKIRLWYLFPCIYSRWGDCNCNLCFPFSLFPSSSSTTAEEDTGITYHHFFILDTFHTHLLSFQATSHTFLFWLHQRKCNSNKRAQESR